MWPKWEDRRSYRRNKAVGRIKRGGSCNAVWEDWYCRVSKCNESREVRGLYAEGGYLDEESKGIWE